MPRDGLQQYSPPPGTQGIPNYTVESARYNTFVADITADQNNPRPIVAGGTGATNAHDAMVALNGEIANQTISNFDMDPIFAGSFIGMNNATNPPSGSAHWSFGACIGAQTGGKLLVAYDVSVDPPVSYTRYYNGATWTPWRLANSGTFVQKAGDTMTGQLSITASTASINLNKTASAGNNMLAGTYNGLGRWYMFLGDYGTESGGNAGSDFQLWGYNDAGTVLACNLRMNRSDGLFSTSNNIQAGGSVIAVSNNYYFGSVGSRYLNWDGSNYHFGPGNVALNDNLIVGTNIYANYANAVGGTYYFGNNGAHSLSADGSGNFFFNGGGTLSVGGQWVAITGAATAVLYLGNAFTHYISFDGSNINIAGSQVIVPSGNLVCSGGEIINNYTSTYNSFRSIMGNYGVFQHMDTTNWYLMVTNNGDPYGGWSGNFPITINLSTHDANFGGAVTATQFNTSGPVYTGDVHASRGNGTGYLFCADNAHYYGWDGTWMQIQGGNILGGGGFYPNGQGTFGIGTSVPSGVVWDGTNVIIRGGPQSGGSTIFHAQNGTNAWGMINPTSLYHISGVFSNQQGGSPAICNTNSKMQVQNGMQVRNGYSGGLGGNCFNNFWNGSGYMFLFVDDTNLGGYQMVSDYRVKKDVLPLPGMWDTVKKLKPIKYTHKNFSPKSHIDHVAEQKKIKAAAGGENHIEPNEHLIVADDIERWGFMAHELQETLTESAAHGKKDADDALQSPNPWTIIAALTKTLQEAMTRIEALEAR